MKPLWNPHFIAYAAAHGRSPEAQLVHDDGIMAGFMVWHSVRLREWRAETGVSGWIPDDRLAEFGMWLEKMAAEVGR